MERKRRPCWGLFWPQMPTEESVSAGSVGAKESTDWSPGRSSSASSLAMFGLPLASLPGPLPPPPYIHTHNHTLSTDSSTKCYSCLLKIQDVLPTRNQTPILIQSEWTRLRRGRENSKGRAPPSCFLFCSLPDRDWGVMHFVHTHIHTHSGGFVSERAHSHSASCYWVSTAERQAVVTECGHNKWTIRPCGSRIQCLHVCAVLLLLLLWEEVVN